MSNFSYLLTSMFAGVVALLQAGAAAANVHSGTLCTSSPTDAPSLNYDPLGIANLSSVARAVICSGVTDGVVTNVSVTVYDRSPGDDVRCTVGLIDSRGIPQFTATLTTSGFSSEAMTLSAVTPAISAGVILQCSIPAFNASNGFSRITSYTITDSL